MKTTKTWKQKTKTVGLATIIGVAVASASIGGSATPAVAHEYCDADYVAHYDDEGQISQVDIEYTSLSELGSAEGANDGLCQARVVVDCENDAGEIREFYGNWSNGKSSVQANQCPASFPTIVSFGWQTAYD